MKKFLIIPIFVLYSLFAFSQCLRANIAIVVDFSGSEMGYERLLAHAMYQFVEELPISNEQVKISISIFRELEESNFTILTELSGDKENVKNSALSILSYSPNGGTLINDVLVESISQFANDDRKDVINFIVIISDGDIYDSDIATTTLRKFEGDMRLNVYAIEIGSIDINSYKILVSLTNDKDKVIFSKPNEIINAFKQINLCF